MMIEFGQITAEEAQETLHQAMTLGVQVILPDESQAHLAFNQALELKWASAYDSFYLVIADALDAEFRTADQRLISSFHGEKPSWLHSADEIG
jgi:predicted nucleic acid-binding protein